jgi:C-terminal processing protease CtpA/Prc
MPSRPAPARTTTARAYIGITADVAAGARVQGYPIARVTPDTPASRAGLLAGDIIVAVNGYGVASVDGFRTMVADLTPGTEVMLTVLRGNENRDVSVILTEPRPQPARTSAAQPASGVINWLGSVEQGGVVDVDSKLLPGVPIDLDIDTEEFTVLEAPSAGNNWKHLVFRCKNRRYTAISIRWTARRP